MVVVDRLDAIYAAIYAALWYAVAHTLPLPASLRTLALCWIILEVVFYLYGKFRLARLQLPYPLHMPPDLLELTFARFLTLADVFPLDEYMTGWFFGAPIETICRGNVLEYIIYGLLYKSQDTVTPEELERTEQFLDSVEERWDVKLTPGYNPALRYMSHSWEPLRVYHKPLLFYAVVEGLARGAHALLRWQGFHQSKAQGFNVWHLHARGVGDRRRGVLEEPLPALSPRRFVAAAQRGRDAALDVALEGVSRATAAMSAQYPHEHQQYHIPSPGAAPRTREASPEGLGPRRGPSAGPSGLASAEACSTPGNGPAHGLANGGVDPLAALPALRTLSAAQLPIVLLHGVGFGVLPYLHFLRNITKALPDHPAMLIEVPHVSLRLCWESAEVDEVAHALAAALRRRDYSRAVVVGHSYGSFVASRFVQLYPEMVHSLVIMDPVCMLVCYPQLLHNFIYRGPTRENFQTVAGGLDLIRFFCSRDLTISQASPCECACGLAFCRKFNWAELMLWPEAMPVRSLVVVSGRDDLVPSSLVLTQLEAARHPAKVMNHPDLGHGGILLLNDWQRQVIATMAKFLAEE